MSDEELIAQWDDYVESMSSVMGEVEYMAQQMRDRIEALVKERDEAFEWLSASQGYIADAVFALDKQEKAEAKLAAMEVIATQWKARAERLEAALREIAKPYPADQNRLIHSQQQIASIARAALKGDDHE